MQMKLADTTNLEKRCEDHLSKVLSMIDPNGDFAQWREQTLQEFRALRLQKFARHMPERREPRKQSLKDGQAGSCCSSQKL